MSKYLLNFIIFFVILAIVSAIYFYGFNSEPVEEDLPEEININMDTTNNETNPTGTDEAVEPEVNNDEPVAQENGLKIEILAEGTGEGAKNGDDIIVHYTGWLTDGTKFDSSLDRGAPFSFVLGQGRVIQGWDQGMLGIKIGEKRKLTIPSELGYGEQGAGASIPPNATLVFEVELLEIK